MGKINWSDVTREDVLDAISIFNSEKPDYPESRSTFLIFEGKRYPAKHIRGMAYKVHFGREIKKENYNGGLQTVNFFENLGFEMEYTNRSVNTHPKKEVLSGRVPKSAALPVQPVAEVLTLNKGSQTSVERDKVSIPTKGVIEQKNALQLLLNRLLNGDVVCEKTFLWMRTPSEIRGEYVQLYNALCAYRGDTSFAKGNKSLRCDFVCESKKLIIEYDERQHFSEARRIALMSYPQIPLNFDRDLWICACKDIQAKDNQPVNRDETRAYYDSTRDIEAAKHGYQLIRIMHGQIDFETEGADKRLIALLDVAKQKETRHIDAQPHPQVTDADDSHRKSIKVGLYLQTHEIHGDLHTFEKAMDVVRASDIDILVFPEFAYFPFVKEYRQSDFLSVRDLQVLYRKTIALSRDIGRAVVICNEDSHGAIMSIYANAFAEDGETVCKNYIKHTMTSFSACDIENYQEYAEEAFQPIVYRGNRIGLTICYDCNHSMFSRKYGLNSVDIILNSTGGNVKYDKWFKYNKVRAIENNCFIFVTMGGDGTDPDKNNCVYGFTPMGKEMVPKLLNGTNSKKTNLPGGIYVYDTSEYDGTTERDPRADQKESPNSSIDLSISVDEIDKIIDQATPLTDGLCIIKHENHNIILCLIDGEDIMRPEKVLKLLYSESLKGISNKRYLIINRWKAVDMGFFTSQLSVVLKVRTMENFCAVILVSENLTKCFQCGNTRTAQVVAQVDGKFGIDLRRTGGPETIWRNKRNKKTGKIETKVHWRDNIEWLISTM